MSTVSSPSSLPERSVLFSLMPIGLGTPGVESLESYVCRLAQRHGVPRRTLERFIHQQGESIYYDVAGPPRLDSPSPLGRRFAERLARLTQRPEVLRLGLSRFEGCLADSHTLRRNRAWCGRCFHEARVAGVPAHLPLLWSLTSYPRCIVHGIVLETVCRVCRRRSDPTNSWTRAIDHCPWCGKDLADGGAAPSLSFAQLAWTGAPDVDVWCGRTLGAFVAQASAQAGPLGGADLRRVVDSAIDRGVAANMAGLTRQAGLPLITLHSLIQRKGNPALAVLVRLATAAGVSMYGILDPGSWCDNDAEHPPRNLGELPRLRKRQYHDWASIRREVSGALARGEVEPASTLAQRLGVDASYLSAKLGKDLYAQVIHRAREARRARRQERQVVLAQQMREARQCLLEQGIRPSANKISKLLERSSRGATFKAAYKAMTAGA